MKHADLAVTARELLGETAGAVGRVVVDDQQPGVAPVEDGKQTPDKLRQVLGLVVGRYDDPRSGASTGSGQRRLPGAGDGMWDGECLW